MKLSPTTYYVWIGGSCDYGHKERAGGGAYIVERDGKVPTEKSANADLILACIGGCCYERTPSRTRR